MQMFVGLVDDDLFFEGFVLFQLITVLVGVLLLNEDSSSNRIFLKTVLTLLSYSKPQNSSKPSRLY